MWNLKCNIVLVIIVEHGNSNKRFKETFGSHTREHSVDSLQKAATLGTSHIIWKVLPSEN